ncbi:nucleotidyl transferase AbiEii/AbiGii toxin family protein [Candidatus Parcubacteria bacterium]|nr:nucleotidyl transferase AbiEii/AbiGii toxin family protein [Candidatus Parcubacteria bacterium]
MHKKVINQKTENLLSKLTESKIIKDFYLAGGTALALQYGHRKSIDLDWFNQKDFDTAKLKKDLAQLGKIIIDSEEKNTLNLTINNVKLSFLGYPYKLLFPFVKWRGIKLADPRDIACMKLDAVSSRGAKKDFIDLYFILKDCSLVELMRFFNKKYQKIEYNQLHILKSLVYFVEADSEPMPIMLQEIDWQEVKKYFQETIKQKFN